MTIWQHILSIVRCEQFNAGGKANIIRCSTQRLKLAMRLAQTAILTWRYTSAQAYTPRRHSITDTLDASSSTLASSVCSSIGLSKSAIS